MCKQGSVHRTIRRDHCPLGYFLRVPRGRITDYYRRRNGHDISLLSPHSSSFQSSANWLCPPVIGTQGVLPSRKIVTPQHYIRWVSPRYMFALELVRTVVQNKTFIFQKLRLVVAIALTHSDRLLRVESVFTAQTVYECSVVFWHQDPRPIANKCPLLSSALPLAAWVRTRCGETFGLLFSEPFYRAKNSPTWGVPSLIWLLSFKDPYNSGLDV